MLCRYIGRTCVHGAGGCGPAAAFLALGVPVQQMQLPAPPVLALEAQLTVPPTGRNDSPHFYILDKMVHYRLHSP